MSHAFPMVRVPAARSAAKPRKTGLTMMVDWGLPLGRQRDLLEMSGDYIDLAKLAVGSVRVYREDQLRAKVALYAEHGVRSFIGGGVIERLYGQDGPDALAPFFHEARRVGIDVVEISDNYVPLDTAERQRQIRLAIACGLQVFGEIGSKHEANEAQHLVAQARECLEAGSEIVIVEAAELIEDGKPKEGLINALRAHLDPAKLLFELTGPWISGVTASGVQDLKKFLIRTFGPDVNLGNVMAEDIFETEMSRQGLGVVQPTTLAWR